MGSSGPSSVSYQAGGTGSGGQAASSSGCVGRLAWLGKVVRRVKAKFEERAMKSGAIRFAMEEAKPLE